MYYNERAAYPAEWLRRLVAAGELPAGIVDERDIRDVSPGDVPDGNAHWFAGIGGWALAFRWAGIPVSAPVWSGSCPCQPFSQMGGDRARGFADERHVWPAWATIIRERRPAIVVGEQVASRSALRWLDTVCSDLEGAGYACAAADLPAAGVGAPHRRQRLFWFAADVGRARRLGDAVREGGSGAMAGLPGAQIPRGWPQCLADQRPDRSSDVLWIRAGDGLLRPAVPDILPLADGIPARARRARAYGNAIVPQLAARFLIAALEALEDL